VYVKGSGRDSLKALLRWVGTYLLVIGDYIGLSERDRESENIARKMSVLIVF
jgi:hypothetical protein